jgi:ribonuclease P protein component
LSIQERGLKVQSELLFALALANSFSHTRVGLTVSGKVGNAVVRNRVRRHLREWFRKEGKAWPAGLDVVVIAKNAAAKASGLALSAAMVKLGQELKKRRESVPPNLGSSKA